MTLFKSTLLATIFFLLLGCNYSVSKDKKAVQNKQELFDSATATIDAWHAAASEADFDAYFNLMTKDAVFLGTEATENWQKDDFKSYAKPHFDKGKAWSFTSVERNMYTNETQSLVWFDELLDTQMGICRGSGVLEMEDDSWKIKHYVLSIAIPNENTKEVISLKKSWDSIYLGKLKDRLKLEE